MTEDIGFNGRPGGIAMTCFAIGCFGVVAVLVTPTFGQTTTRISVASSGAQGNSSSFGYSISAEGQFVAFSSSANNFVPDYPGAGGVFVRDRLTGTTEWMSRALDGGQANGSSDLATISADGRYVAFYSWATNMVANVDTNGYPDIFVRDRLTGTTELISVNSTGDAGSGFISFISADGRYVAFRSWANDLVSNDTNFTADVFVRDRQLGTTELVSLSSSGVAADTDCTLPAISADGRYVTFLSRASTLVPGDTNLKLDVFLRDRQTGTTELVSVGLLGVPGDGDVYDNCFAPISADGRFVGFASRATNLVASDTNGGTDVFVRDRLIGTTERVSLTSSGAQAPTGAVGTGMSLDGRFVTFAALDALVPDDTDSQIDLYLRDRAAGITERLSVSSTGVQGNDSITNVGIMTSLDGRYAAFTSAASNLVPGDSNGWEDVFLRDRGPALAAFCFGDGSAAPCPCGNSGSSMHGCENSSSTGGAILAASGTRSLSADTLVLTTSGERPSVLSIVLQGNATLAPASYGDGLRCVGGSLKRLYVRTSVGGVVIVPEGSDPSVSARSAALGDVIHAGASRYYQTYYRDSNLSFCPHPTGNTWNISSAIEVVWDY